MAYKDGDTAAVLDILEDGSQSILSTINRAEIDKSSDNKLGSTEGYYEYKIDQSSLSKNYKDIRIKQTIDEVNEDLQEYDDEVDDME